MKTIYKYIGSLGFMLIISGCYDLEQVNPNQLTEDTFFLNETQMREAAFATYDQLQSLNVYGQDLHIIFSALSDEGTNEQPFEFNEFARFIFSDTDAIGNPFWVANYAVIGRAYQVLDREAEFDLPGLYGEMRFMVALGYFNLVGYFGENIALVEGIQGGLDRPQTAEDGEIYALMEDLLLLAIPDLPFASEYASEDYGRVTKGAAQTLLAKIYLQQQRFQDAEPLLSAVINSGEYGLLPNFEDIFTDLCLVNQEAVFVVNFLEDGNAGNTDVHRRHQIFAIAEEAGAFGDIQATNLMLNAFNAEEAASGSKDSRMDHTIIHPDSDLTYYELSGETWASFAPNQELVTGFMKYSEQDAVGNNVDPVSGNATNFAVLEDGGTDYIVLRYADVLLLYAEVLNELGRTGEAGQFVDQVRTRAGRPGFFDTYPAAAGGGQAFVDQIMTERILELAGENWRFFDLKRRGMYNSANQVNDANFATFTDGQDEVAPIPQTQLDINENLRPNQAN